MGEDTRCSNENLMSPPEKKLLAILLLNSTSHFSQIKKQQNNLLNHPSLHLLIVL